MTTDAFLTDAKKQFTGDQDKACPPAETVETFQKRAADSGLDILRETRRIDSGRLDIPVYVSICGYDAHMMTGTAKQMGKGGTPEQAQASALMELAERFSFYSFVSNPARFTVDTRENLGSRAIPFEVLARSVNEDPDSAEAVRPFLESLSLRWTEARNLSTGEKILLPFDWFFAINEFNGTCAGNCQEEAICQGICEVVERHVSCLAARERPSIPGIDPATADHPAVTELLAKYDSAGIRLYFSDFTLDTGIPTVSVLACDPAAFPEKGEIVWTAGSAPDPQKAMSRALTETAQLAGDFEGSGNYVASGLPKLKTVEEGDFLTGPAETVSVSDLPDLSSDNFKTEIENCLAALSADNLDVYVIDITDPQLRLPAFYTIIPGARFFQRAENASTGMFTAKLMAETMEPEESIPALLSMAEALGEVYYLSFYIGLAHLAAGRPETALTHLYQALHGRPVKQDAVSIYSYLGFCLKETGHYQDALAELKRGLALDAERTDILNLMGFCHFKLAEHERAIDCFQSILKLDPGSAIDYANIASNYREMGETEKAIFYYQRALELDPALDFARENLERLSGQ